MKKLFIVGTPIGNFDDITLRALNTLKEVDYIACEDTRVTKKLLNHFQIKNKKLISYHNFNERTSAKGIIELLKNNFKVALVSDAGMPTISDPGFELIQEARKNDIEVNLIPGVSALTSAITMSNLGPNFTFLGFGKQTKGQFETQIKSLIEGTYVFFCAPNKIMFFLETLNKHHKDSFVFIGREMTKIHETFYYGFAHQVIEQIKDKLVGEMTIVFKINKTKKEKSNKYKKC